ncbi:hypothetical protein ACFQYP_26730 [Nonomuraea antimicrobica]
MTSQPAIPSGRTARRSPRPRSFASSGLADRAHGVARSCMPSVSTSAARSSAISNAAPVVTAAS